MKLLLSSAGFDKNPKIAKAFLELVNKNPSEIRIFLVTIVEKDNKSWRWVKFIVKQLGKIGINSKNIIIFSLDRKIKWNDLRGIDVIYVCGGNTFVYLDKIRKIGLDKIIKRFIKEGKTYFGVSAGSYVLCPTIEMSTWKPTNTNTIGLKDLTGLALVPFWLVAHYDKGYLFILKKVAETTKYPIIALRDNQAVLVKDGEVKIIGPGEKITFNLSDKFNTI